LSIAGDHENNMIKVSLNYLLNRDEMSLAALIPNAHHGWMGENPQLFTDMVSAWIEQKSLPFEMIKLTRN